MRLIFVGALVALLAISAAPVNADKWAVLVAGSNTYSNYRHQSDICHSYQILRNNGFPANRIITLGYDDIANYRSNPYQGQVFNKPTPVGVPGRDIWAGCRLDYTGQNVTAKNFLAVLTGDSVTTGGLPVLRSNSQDNIFIYYSDHGSNDLVAFPSGGYLYKNQLMDAFKTMQMKNMYNKVVFYLEACESGSMFANVLPNDMNIYAITAANPTESSWAYYCGSEATVNGRNIGSCLGDEFSIQWLESAEVADTNTMTLDEHFQLIKGAVRQSHVMRYGDVSFANEPLANFIGSNKTSVTARLGLARTLHNVASSVDSRDAPLDFLYNKYVESSAAVRRQASVAGAAEFLEASQTTAIALQREIAERQWADAYFVNVARESLRDLHAAGRLSVPTNVDLETFVNKDVIAVMREGTNGQECKHQCCQRIIEAHREACLNGEPMSDYALQYARTLSGICMRAHALSAQDITPLLEKRVRSMCESFPNPRMLKF